MWKLKSPGKGLSGDEGGLPLNAKVVNDIATGLEEWWMTQDVWGVVL